jgi:hypothetical protein
MDFIYANYPLGSFDTRPPNSSDVSATLPVRKFLLQKTFETYPKRRFVLIADTSNQRRHERLSGNGNRLSGPSAVHFSPQHLHRPN